MINLWTDPWPPATSPVTAEGALSFIYKGWQEVRDSAGADLQLMRARARSFKSLADRELENFLNSAASPFALASSPAPEIQSPQPKLSDVRRAYWSPDFSGPRSRISMNLSEWRDAVVSEADVLPRASWNLDRSRGRRVRWKDWREEGEEEKVEEWEPIRLLKNHLKEVEYIGQSNELFESFRNSEFLEKCKSSLKSFYMEPQESQEVPPLGMSELLAYFVKQCGPFLDHIGVKRELCDKIAGALYSKRKDPILSSHSISTNELASLGNDSINDELDLRIASVIESTGHHYDGGFWMDCVKPDTQDKKRHVAIVTTASLPWMTGTAVNPLFRAAYIARAAKQNVTLVVPWLCKSDQELVYPNSMTFCSPEDQEAYIRSWLEERTGFKADFRISFYPGKFSKERRSIIPVGDTTQFLSSKEADIAILEEPEHLNWYHHGRRWTDKFNHVIGVVHTNYLEYIKREKYGSFQAFLVKHINNIVTRAHCHKVLRLSKATQDLPKSVVCNVHGVNPKFLKIGEKIAVERENGQHGFSEGAYFLGKMVWAKGYRELLDLWAKHRDDLDGFKLDVYGNGEDLHEVRSEAKTLNLNINFLRGRDHADDSLHRYKVFINPSVSDVLCTATAEALAMGKFVVCADHPSNDFFRMFPNCLTYKTSDEFVARVKEAASAQPLPLTPEQSFSLTWEAATQRFLEYSELNEVLVDSDNGDLNRNSRKAANARIKRSVSMPSLSEVVDGGLAFAHYCFTGNEILRLASGAIPRSRDIDAQQCTDLNLLPPMVQHPIYGW